MDKQKENLRNVLDRAMQALRILEEQAAGYTVLTIPVSLSIELGEKRKEVADLAERLKIDPTTLRRSVQHNLPPLITEFVGREKELADIRNLLKPTSTHYRVAIYGVGGIGKTTLVREVARRYVEPSADYPDAELFDTVVWVSAILDIPSDDGIPLRTPREDTLKHIINVISFQLGREEILRLTTVAEQIQAIYEALGKTRALLVIDNLDTVEDSKVRDFLTELPMPTRVLVTSRTRINAAYAIDLKGLPQDKAVDLMKQESKSKNLQLSEEDCYKIYTGTGGVPLAIVLSIGRIRKENINGRSIDHVLDSLTEPKGDFVEFCFQKSLEVIKGTPTMVVLRALSVFPRDASREALQFVTTLSATDLQDSLNDLENLSLISKQYSSQDDDLPTSERYSLLHIIKIHVGKITAEIEFQPRLRQWSMSLS